MLCEWGFSIPAELAGEFLLGSRRQLKSGILVIRWTPTRPRFCVLRFFLSGRRRKNCLRRHSCGRDGPRPEDTAFELFGAALDDVGMQRKESNRYDPNMLRRIAGYRCLFSKGGLRRIVIPDTTLATQPLLDASITNAARVLCDATPKPRRVRMSGRLDLIGASQGVLKVHVGKGSVVAALWEGKESINELVALFNRDVVCEGTAVFRPSGSLLRVDIDVIALATATEVAFAYVPQAIPIADLARSMRLRPNDAPTYSTFLSSVPAEESDDSFAAAVEAMS